MRFVRKYSGLFITGVFFGLVVFAWLHRLDLWDYWRLRGYQPPAAIAQLASDTTMDPGARNIFYAQHPEIVADKQTFNDRCRVEQTIVLGCYVLRTGIYVFSVTDARLAGVEQVTAAHEMLHAAYDRLSARDKTRINALITETYADITDQRIRETVEQYRKAKADTTNELHSILGTEVRNLPPELEAYYRRYFTDRSKIVSYSEQYEQAFTARHDKYEEYAKQMEELKVKIDAHKAELDSRLDDINSQEARLNKAAQNNDAATYNSGLPKYRSAIEAYNALIATTKAEVTQYNQLLDQRNALALEEQELNAAIDSHLTAPNAK